MEKDTMERTELENWKRIIVDGDWAVMQRWKEFERQYSVYTNDNFSFKLEPTPESIKFFLAWMIRTDNQLEYMDWEDKNPPRKSKSSLPKMGVDGAGLKFISKLEKEKK